MLTTKNYIRTVMVIDPEWMFMVAPEYFDLDEFSGETRRKVERVMLRVFK